MRALLRFRKYLTITVVMSYIYMGVGSHGVLVTAGLGFFCVWLSSGDYMEIVTHTLLVGLGSGP